MVSQYRGYSATKIALLQSKFHRIIKHRLSELLKPFGLHTVEWVVLGYLGHKKRAIVMSQISSELGVQQTFMTVCVSKLEKKGLVVVTNDQDDLRKKYIA